MYIWNEICYDYCDYMYTSSEKAFTLVEIIVVISIMTLLMTFGFSSYTNAQRRARDTKRAADMNEFINAINLFQLNERRGPIEDDFCESSIGNAGGSCPVNPPQRGWVHGGVWDDLVGGGYLKELPIDPLNNQGYYYYFEPTNPAPNSGGYVRVRFESPDQFAFYFWSAP